MSIGGRSIGTGKGGAAGRGALSAQKNGARGMISRAPLLQFFSYESNEPEKETIPSLLSMNSIRSSWVTDRFVLMVRA